MLVAFHSLVLLIRELRKTLFSLEDGNQIHFDPPMYIQRYGRVHEIFLKDRDIKKIVDFGCAEMGFFFFLRQLYSLEEVFEVDIDATLLSDHIRKVDPTCDDYMDKRGFPFKVHILAGSICDPSPRLIGTDAVVGIEIIEHLYPDTLDALPFNVFNCIKPKLAIFTTPNADFNVLFSNFKGVRHLDHKFEWTREQFQSWGKNLAVRFPNYSVTFEGIGKGLNGTENLGCCSQMALFTRKSIAEDNLKSDALEESFGVCTYFSYTTEFVGPMKYPFKLERNSDIIDEGHYRLIKTVEYPFNVDDKTPEQRILGEFVYKISLSLCNRYYNKDEDVFEIPLINLFLNQRYSCTFNEASKILQGAGYTIEERILFNELTTCVIAKAKSCVSSSSSRTPSVSDEEYKNHAFDELFLENEYDWSNQEVENGVNEWNCIDETMPGIS